jgi:hypothetical protein
VTTVDAVGFMYDDWYGDLPLLEVDPAPAVTTVHRLVQESGRWKLPRDR